MYFILFPNFGLIKFCLNSIACISLSTFFAIKIYKYIRTFCFLPVQSEHIHRAADIQCQKHIFLFLQAAKKDSLNYKVLLSDKKRWTIVSIVLNHRLLWYQKVALLLWHCVTFVCKVSLVFHQVDRIIVWHENANLIQGMNSSGLNYLTLSSL